MLSIILVEVKGKKSFKVLMPQKLLYQHHITVYHKSDRLNLNLAENKYFHTHESRLF